MSADDEAPAHSQRDSKRLSLILTVWTEIQSDRLPVWRGCIETAGSQRVYFNTLDKLKSLLVDLGWHDPPLR